MTPRSLMGKHGLNVSKQLLRNTVTGWLEMLVLLVSTIVVTPLLIARLGKAGYGVWMLVGQVIAYLGVIDFGVGSSVGRFVAKYSAGEDPLYLSRIVNSAIFLFIISSCIIVLATLILCFNFSEFFELRNEYYNVGRWLILLTGCGVALNFPLRIGQGVLEGTHNFHLIYLFRALGTFVKLSLIGFFFGLRNNDSLILVAVISVAATVLPSMFMCRTAVKKLPNASLGLQYVNLSSIREIWSLSLSVLLGTLATLLFNQGQIIGVGKLVGPESVMLYTIPIMLLTYGSMLTSYIVAAFKPMASHLQALNDTKALRELNIKGVQISVTVCMFIAVFAIAFGYPLFRIWLHSSSDLSDEDFALMYRILVIMVIGFAVGAPQKVTSSMFSGIDRQWFAAIVCLSASIMGLLLGIVLMTKTALGLGGMAVGWAAVFLVRGVLVFPISACRHFRIKVWFYLRRAYLPPIIAAMVLVAAAYVTRAVFDLTSMASLALCMAFCVGIYAVAVYFFCLDEGQRLRIRGVISRLST